MSIVLCTLALNEMEHLPRLYQQHKDWPELVKWIFVESADKVYAQVNPELSTDKGLSVDGTSDWLNDLSKKDDRVVYIPHGFSSSSDPAQGKCESRSRYLEEVDKVKPNFLFILDADEYYTFVDQKNILKTMENGHHTITAWCFKHRHPWHPPSLDGEDLFKYEVTGGFWDIPLCRGWRWYPGLKYKSNHNTPEYRGRLLDRNMDRVYRRTGIPACVHMAFTSSIRIRHAKHIYYAARGEGRVDHRGWYVESRAAFEVWKPGDKLPNNAKVSLYDGPIPECYRP